MSSLARSLVDGALAVPGLEEAADALEGAVRAAYAPAPAAPLKDALHGTWLGHALHPEITDVPVGAWTAALALDLAGERRGAKIAVGVGLLGALAAAATGLTDWVETQGRPRKLGVVHATLNGAATLLYGASYVLRPQAQRTASLLAFAGYSLTGLSALYGGELSLDMLVGANHAHEPSPPAGDVDVCALDELPEGSKRRVDAHGYPVLLVRRDGIVRALGAVCAHAGGPLDEGTIEGDVVTCPWHGSQFCTRDGGIVRGPTAYPQPAFRVRVKDGRVRVQAVPSER